MSDQNAKKKYLGQLLWKVILLCCLSWGLWGVQATSVALPSQVTFTRENSNEKITLRIGRDDTSLQIDGNTVQCVDSAFQLPGQAWHVDLSAGGITFQADKPKIKVDVIDIANRVSILRLSQSTIAPQLGNLVTLLIIDDFVPLDITLDEDNSQLGSPLTWKVSHGAMVVNHVETALQASQFTKIRGSGGTFFDKGDLFKSANGSRLVKTVTFDYGGLRENQGVYKDLVLLSKMISSLKIKIDKYNIERYLVVNMSFSIIPCGILERYKLLKDKASINFGLKYPFDQYLKAVDDLSSKKITGWTSHSLRDILTTVHSSNGLEDWLKAQQSQRTTVAIASSGNYGLPYETMPAALPNVVGVGSSNSTDPSSRKIKWSDDGDVIETGQWFKLTMGTNRNFCESSSVENCISPIQGANNSNWDKFAYRGTSFSAPTVAVAFATRIGSNGCFPTPLIANWLGITKIGNTSFAGVFSAKCR